MIDERIHIKDWVFGIRGGGFLRMVVHEMGHATFQRLLITGERWTGEGRGRYLASQFVEFCAESFMHLALEKRALQSHIDTLPEEEPNIKAAWQSALAILLKYERQILGRQAGEATATLRTHRFITVLQKLKDGLKGPDLEVVKIEAVKENLQSLRRAWLALTNTERERYQSDALMILDQYVMKVQRRRPVQAHLASELGFSGL